MGAVCLPNAPGVGAAGVQLIDYGMQLLAAGDLAAARSALTTAVTVDATPAARYCLAELLASTGEITAAVGQLERAWEQARCDMSPTWRAKCCHALAELHRSAGAIDLANRWRQLAIRADLDAGDAVDAAAWLRDRAGDAVLAGELEDAHAWARVAQRISSQGPNDSGPAHFVLGTLCVREGRWAQGLRWFVRAFHAARKHHDWRGCAAAVLNVGHILQARGRWQRAAACFVHAARLLHRLQDATAARQATLYARECQRFLAACHGDPQRN